MFCVYTNTKKTKKKFAEDQPNPTRPDRLIPSELGDYPTLEMGFIQIFKGMDPKNP